MASGVLVTDPSIRNEVRFGWPIWVATVAILIGVHFVLFGYMQNLVDLRPCIGYSPDPFMKWIPMDERWRFVTLTLYLWVAAGVLLVMIFQAIRGLQYPLVLLLMASSITSTMRIVTLYLLPLCNPLVTPGGATPLQGGSITNLTLFALPFRPFAVNDLVFSGHIGIYMLALYATPHWPRPVRVALGGFIIVMMYGLISTREHYTIDLLLAIPCSFLGYSIAKLILERLGHIYSRRSVAS